MLILKLLLLLVVANGAPIIAGNVFGRRFAFPVDGYVSLADGQRLIGPTKTIRGILLSVVATPMCASLLGPDQIPESLFPMLACKYLLSLSLLDIVLAVVAFFVVELLLSRILYELHIRDKPY